MLSEEVEKRKKNTGCCVLYKEKRKRRKKDFGCVHIIFSPGSGNIAGCCGRASAEPFSGNKEGGERE